MLGGRFAAFLALVTVAAFAGRATGGESPLTDADRRAFTWFDGIGLPSCAGKKYVRVTWVRKAPPADAPPAERLWEIDGFLVAEGRTRWTILDADQIARRIDRAPPEWTTSVATLDLAATAGAAAARLRAMVSDPGAVEPIEQVFHGVRHLVGDEALALSLARHCAENRLDAPAHELLGAARALPPGAGAKPGTAVETIAAGQLAEPLMRRILWDLGDADAARKEILERLRGWRRSFPASPHIARADEAIRILEPMAKEDAEHRAIPDSELAKLAPADRAKELVFRLRDQTGDVAVSRARESSLALDGGDSPVDRLVAMDRDAIPALLDALADARFTRAVLFRFDNDIARQFVARVGDVAQVALERIASRRFREPAPEAPSMFQDGSEVEVERKWREWWASTADLASRLAALAAEKDFTRRAALARELPDRGTERLPGAARAVWGTRSFADAVPGLDADAAKALLRTVVAESPRPRMKALAAWALLDYGAADAVPSMVRAWQAMDEGLRADPEQGGAVISFLAACGRPEAVAALADGLDARAPAVRELVVLAFDASGFGAVRGFAADGPDGVRETWTLSGAAADAAQDLFAARLADVAEDPLGRIPRQVPICDMVPAYDCGRRIADAATRLLASRWPSVFAMRSEPVRPADEWESLRVRFLDAWKQAKAARAPR
jgi:hypothetical protein